MEIAVQKFGGTSLATADFRARVCEIIKATKAENKGVVVVVSAIGRDNDPYATDTFIRMVKETNPNPSPRELDFIMSCGESISGVLLASQLSAMGIESRILNGKQAGIITDGNFGNAHILYINPKNIIDCLENNIVPVVTGFQGISEDGELTTLGRGGSDTTASALGVALNAEIVDIFTDVEGVMTADPRIVKNARLLSAITYNEICQLSREGAKVIHPRAIEIAMQNGIPLRVRSPFGNSRGTLVSNGKQEVSNNSVRIIGDNLITGIAHVSNIVQIKVNNADAEDRKINELKVFRSLALANISVDFISVQPEATMFTVSADSAGRTIAILENIDIYPEVNWECAKVAIIGAAMTGVPGVMVRVVEALNENNIPILQSGDSYTNIWCLVKRGNMEQAVKVLHDKFELGKN